MIFRRFWWASLLAVACLAFSAHYSRLAPCGAWANAIFGEQAWGEADPGGFYFASAHELAWGEAPLFVGHPGATLTPLLHAVQRGLHLGAGGASFTRFTAQHLPEAFLLSKLLMTLLHLLSFAALHALAREVLRDDRAATVATLGYATSLPVLYYLSRISVEPLMVLCFAGSFWATWRCEERARQGRVAAAGAFAGLAGFAAVSGAMTKLAFLGPLPFFLALHLLADGGRPGGERPLPRPVRWRSLAVFGLSGLAALGLYSQIIDWSEFVAAWRGFARKPFGGWELADLLPGLGASRIFLTAELGFGLCAAAGWVHFLRHRPRQRRRALWLSAYGFYGLMFFAYRVALEGSFLPFHYAFVALATGAVFFGWASVLLWQRLPIGAGWRGAVTLALWLAVLHGAGLLAVVDARRHDVEAFERRQPFFPLLARVGSGDRLGAVVPDARLSALRQRLVQIHGFIFPTRFHPRTSALREEIESLVVAIPPKAAPQGAPGAPIPVLEARIVLLRGGAPRGPGL
jgi:hypothetical protein